VHPDKSPGGAPATGSVFGGNAAAWARSRFFSSREPRYHPVYPIYCPLLLNHGILNTMNQKQQQKRPAVEFLCSAAQEKDFPQLQGDEFAILGRSNVGKSSFINHVLEKPGLARTSRTPGKTTLANFFRVDESMIWVDLPGYGYARASGSERERWSVLIRAYCETRKNLRGLVWLIDIRHPGVAADLEARAWIEGLGVGFFPVLTKVDKINRSQIATQVRKAVTELRLPGEPLTYSIMQHGSRDRFRERFAQWRQSITGAVL
jgi:GTP-binding protein